MSKGKKEKLGVTIEHNYNWGPGKGGANKSYFKREVVIPPVKVDNLLPSGEYRLGRLL